MREVRHVYPAFDDEPEHVTGGAPGRRGECWCRPTVKVICGQCGGVGFGCWRCDGAGLVVAEGYDDAPAAVVIHNAVGARGKATSEAP